MIRALEGIIICCRTAEERMKFGNLAEWALEKLNVR